MDKIDLIIDALEKAQDGWQCFDEYEKALAAARELKALKPVAWMMPDYGDVLSASEADGTGIYSIPLYTAPPLKEWVGLTDADLMKEFGYTDELLRDTAYRVEQILAGRNT